MLVFYGLLADHSFFEIVCSWLLIEFSCTYLKKVVCFLLLVRLVFLMLYYFCQKCVYLCMFHFLLALFVFLRWSLLLCVLFSFHLCFFRICSISPYGFCCSAYSCCAVCACAAIIIVGTITLMLMCHITASELHLQRAMQSRVKATASCFPTTTWTGNRRRDAGPTNSKHISVSVNNKL